MGIGRMLERVEAEHHRQKRMELEGAWMLIEGAGSVLKGLAKCFVVLFLFVMVVGIVAGHPQPSGGASCHGKIVKVYLPRSKYPNIDAHIEASWKAGYPHTLRVHREGAAQRRAHLLAWWTARHPQPKNDGLDLDEEPAAMLRSSWKADVRPIGAHENRASGASLGSQLRGVPDGTCVRYSFASR
jgi:hypothetical protein